MAGKDTPDNWNNDPTPGDDSRGEMIEIIDDGGTSAMDREAEKASNPRWVTGLPRRPPLPRRKR